MATALLIAASGFAHREGSHDRLPAEHDLQLRPEWAVVLNHRLGRILSWRVPPNWTARDWSEEMRAQGAAAAWQDVCDYDPTRGVPLRAFLGQRVLTSALTRYREEWRYVMRCVRDLMGDGCGEHAEDDQSDSILGCDVLYHALARLSLSDRALIEQLFWKGENGSGDRCAAGNEPAGGEQAQARGSAEAPERASVVSRSLLVLPAVGREAHRL